MVENNISEDQVWEWLKTIPDPEIPVITITDLGVVRKVELSDLQATVTITPTYTGCPAMKMFEDEIIKELKSNGIKEVIIKMVYSPAWTTDWISDEAKQRLKAYGIAPPVSGSQDKGVLFENGPKVVQCPQCNSNDTALISQFGSTACKALYKCKDCLEPFDYFKCI